MIQKYRKKPVVVEVVKWTGENEQDIIDLESSPTSCLYFQNMGHATKKALFIKTLEGTMYTAFGDYVIKGVNGELYPCKPDIFEKTYELVEED